MYKNDLSGKRLLLVGGVGSAMDLITLARRNGVFIGVADYNKDTSVKRAADAAYDINVTDVDAVVKLYRDERFDGMISNFSDMLSPFVAEAAQRVGAYVPFTIEQLRMSTDKRYFKQVCREYGVPVPMEYPILSEADVGKVPVDYPVIVKPVDGSGSKGISICENEGELRAGIQKALATSRHGQMIVEQCIPHDEINVTYIAQDGDIQLAAIHDRYFNQEQAGSVKVPDLYVYPSRYTDRYLECYNDAVIRMLKGIGVRNGSLFMQACVKDNQVYFYEAGMRLNGCKTYQILEVENDYNTFERLMRFALTGSMGEHCAFNPKFKRWYATWNVVGKPGAVIDRFVGLEELKSYPWLIQAAIRYLKGDTIPANSGGTLIQLLGRIHLYGATKDQLLKRIDIMQSLLRVEDANGESALIKPHDVADLRNRIDYPLF